MVTEELTAVCVVVIGTTSVDVSNLVVVDVSSKVRVVKIEFEVVSVKRRIDVLWDTWVATDVLVVPNTSVSVSVVNAVDVIPGTSIVRTVVLEMGIVAVVTVREVLPKISVVSKVNVVLEISVKISVVNIVEMLSDTSTVW